MMTLTLEQYCEKHGYEVIEQYSTLGEERIHLRAKVKNNKDEVYHLYYDRSRRFIKYDPVTHRPTFRVRGWRNTTLDNRKRKKK